MNTPFLNSNKAAQALDYASWRAYEAKRYKEQTDRRADNLPFYISAHVKNELTCTGTLKHDDKCDVCLASCPKKTTPVYVHNSKEVVFCRMCLQELLDTIENVDLLVEEREAYTY